MKKICNNKITTWNLPEQTLYTTVDPNFILYDHIRNRRLNYCFSQKKEKMCKFVFILNIITFCTDLIPIIHGDGIFK